jgi:crossover junction endodeoxyribonuclease RuvC
VAGGVILGIDPGLGGALAFLLPGGRAEVFDMPTGRIGKGRAVDEAALSRMLDARSRDIEFAYLEQQWARPTDGGPQGFKLGVGYGQLRMLLASNFIPFATVSPQRWKRHFNIGSDKEACRLVASQLLPKSADQWPLKKHEGRAEAALIALYGHYHPIRAEAA